MNISLSTAGSAGRTAPEVQLQGERLEAMMQKLRGVALSLDDRLCAVLRPHPPAEDTKPGPVSVLVPLAEKLKEFSESAEATVAILESILQRLEL